MWKLCLLTAIFLISDGDAASLHLLDESNTDINVNKLISALKYKSSFQSQDVISDTQNAFLWKIKIKHSLYGLDPDANRNLTELIESQGYPVQKFVVQTEDGFLLDLHRIPYGHKSQSSNKPKPSVFLQHGLLSSACDWVMNFANNSLGFILADNGYDVWMGNSRGNTYSRRHIHLKPDDDRFWDWSFDEMAKYDTPAFVNFILNKTGESSLYYIGHSQGTITAFALFSQQPEFQKKIRLFVGLAPIISLNHMESPIKFLSVLPDQIGYDILGRRDFLPNDEMVKFAVDNLCDEHLTDWVCYNLLFLLAGPDVTNLNQSRMVVYMNHSPAGASVKDMIHFSQWYREKRFAMYDYGSPAENMKHYGQKVPPAYNASKVNVPSLLFTAPNDWLADPKDVKILESTLPNIKAKYVIPSWNHLDFLWAINAAEQCYTKILEWLPKF